MSGFPKVAAALNPALQYNDLLGWTYDGYQAENSITPTGAASIQLARIPLPAPLTVTNVIICGTTVGLTLTNSFLALFKSNGTVIGQSVDQSTAWGAGGSNFTNYVLPLVGGPYACTPLAANDFLWAALYIGAAATLPAFYGTYISGPSQTPSIAQRIRCGNIGQANTAKLGNIVPGNITIYPIAAIWFGIS